jgi:hypothetical protein
LVQVIAMQAADAGFAVGFGKAEELHQIAACGPLLVALRSGPNPVLDATPSPGSRRRRRRPQRAIDGDGSLLTRRGGTHPCVGHVHASRDSRGVPRRPR